MGVGTRPPASTRSMAASITARPNDLDRNQSNPLATRSRTSVSPTSPITMITCDEGEAAMAHDSDPASLIATLNDKICAYAHRSAIPQGAGSIGSLPRENRMQCNQALFNNAKCFRCASSLNLSTEDRSRKSAQFIIIVAQNWRIRQDSNL